MADTRKAGVAMEMVPTGGPVEVAGATYRAARADAAQRTPFMRRWRTRTLLRWRSEGRATPAQLIELQAFVDEHRAQGGELLA